MRLSSIMIILFLALTGCKAIDEFMNMQPLEIESYSPSGKKVLYSSVTDIRITFSAEMNKSRAEGSFSMTKNGSLISGNFSWDGSTLIFTPSMAIENNSIYLIEMSTDAEDTYGNSLPEKFTYTFSTAMEDGKPYFVSSIPADRQSVTDQLLSIRILFSEALDIESVYSSFSIFPDVDGVLSLAAGDSEIIFTPLSKYEEGTDYTVTVSDTLRDLCGNNITDKCEVFFSMESADEGEIIWFGDPDNNEYSDSEITAVNQNIEKGITLKLTLDSEAGESMKENPVTVSPSSAFRYEWNTGFTECLVIFDNPLLYDEIYEIQSGDKLYRLHINGASSRPPVLDKIVFCNDSSSPVFEELTINKGINFQTSDSAFFDFYFTLSDGAALSDTAIFGSVSFRTVNGDLSVDPLRVINPALSASPAPSPAPSAGQYVFRIECSVTAGTHVSPFRIEFDTTLADSLSNSIGEEIILQVTSL